MKDAFDDLAKALASGMSRREALRRAGIAAAGTLFFFRPVGAYAGEGGNCKHFCRFVYGEGTSAYKECLQSAKKGKGACYEFGPKSKACREFTCPEHTFCVTHEFNGDAESFADSNNAHCVPER